MNPISVNNALPGRNMRRYSLRGAHQSVDQPRLAPQFRRDPARRSWRCMGTAARSIRIHSIGREVNSLPRHSSHAAIAITAMKIVPSPTMM